MGSLEIRNEETQTTIPTPLSSLRKILSSDKKIDQKLTDIVSIPTTNTSKHAHVKKLISSKYSHLLDRANDIVLQEALRCKFEKSSPSITSCMEDDFHSQHDEHQEDDAPLEGEKRVKRSKKSKRSKSTRDEVIPEDETPKLIAEFHNIDKRVPTIFDHTRMEATLRDTLSNQYKNAKEYAYHLEQSTNFMENQIVWERRQQDIPHIVPKTPIFYGSQRNPNEPPRSRHNEGIRERNFHVSKSLTANEDMGIFYEWKTNSTDDEASVIINP
ncbi:hypothetical protein Tco_0499248 [Tanacetum coccineum]